MRSYTRLSFVALAALAVACPPAPEPVVPPEPTSQPTAVGETPPPAPAGFQFRTETVGDADILRYEVPGFTELSLSQKTLVYYLYEAALSGRDIIYDQKYRHGLTIRRTLEAIIRSGVGDRKSSEWGAFMDYAKRVWFARGIHHDNSGKKFLPGFTAPYFKGLLDGVDESKLPLAKGETKAQLAARLEPLLFSFDVDSMAVNRTPGADVVVTSANNFYEGVTQKEVEAFYEKKRDKKDPRPVSHGLNSKLVKEKGKLVEKVWKVGGMYSPAIEKIVFWLEKAITVAENDKQKKALELLVEYYKTGDLAKFDAYNVAWVADTDSRVDVVNGFIETYGDPLGYRATYEAVVSIRDLEATKRIATLGQNAQWFEDHAPLLPAHRKKEVVGISAKVITVVVEAGDAAPTTPVGVNLPNSDWIRKDHGSKSVMLGNIMESYRKSREQSGALEEFTYADEHVALANQHEDLAVNLVIDLHEAIGHASGQLEPGVAAPNETLKTYESTLEEARADLFALYYIMDPKLVELGVMPSLDVGKAAYQWYIRANLLALFSRIALGDDIQQSHLRNRALITRWCFERGKADKVIEQLEKGGKTYFVVRDYDKLRKLFGEFLREIQRIKSQGDYAAAKKLVEGYGVKVDRALHKEVLDRFSKLGVMPYSGFIQPRLVPVLEGEAIVDVKLEYPDDFAAQQLEYAERYSFLPHVN